MHVHNTPFRNAECVGWMRGWPRNISGSANATPFTDTTHMLSYAWLVLLQTKPDRRIYQTHTRVSKRKRKMAIRTYAGIVRIFLIGEDYQITLLAVPRLLQRPRNVGFGCTRWLLVFAHFRRNRCARCGTRTAAACGSGLCFLKGTSGPLSGGATGDRSN